MAMKTNNIFARFVRPIRASLKIATFSIIGATIALSAAQADDTEVFFSQAEGDSSTHPNILFILDNSGSMGNPAVGGGTKLQAMKDAMNDIIDTADNINLGMVNFLNAAGNHGSELVYPVTPINTPGARQAMKDVVNAMNNETNTPLVGALYESAMIMRGGNIQETATTYTSPILGECQSNHIVMLSDGQAWQNEAVAKTQALIGQTCPLDTTSFGTESGQCGIELAQWLANTDHKPSFSKEMNITVSTIGFNISSTYLNDVATAGEGEYYEADRSEELVDVFNEIITTVKDIETTFVAPATSISQFNRLTQSNDLFFAMFKPASTSTWSGNLKRYQLGYQGGEIVIKDVNNNLAVDPATGFFKDTAQSDWSDVVDGNTVAIGGAAGELQSNTRAIYTHVGALPNGGSALSNVLNETNASIATLLALILPAERSDLIKWIKGIDIKGEVATSNERKHMGSILHSAPVTVNYGGGKSLVYVGTNEGFLHAINKNDGTEEFAFLPQELIPNLIDFYTNKGAKNRPYGLDGDISLLHTDDNGNSIVDGADKAYLYVGMRRGGDDYYALDITNPNSPRLMWRLDGGNGDFADLGQTWSKATPTKIQFNGSSRDVLIFGGGYDTNQDPDDNSAATTSGLSDTVGSTIYIVDALTGNKIWSASDNIAGVSADMTYSIPSDLRIIDVNGDTFADRIYVGDMGGQVWRFDIKAYHQTSDGINGLVDGGVIANLSTPANTLRFYNEPDVALMSHEGERFMSVSIGSGWRAHPLDDVVEDRFYMLRDNSPLVTPEGYGMRSGISWKPVEESDLTNVTNSVSADRAPGADREGWMINLVDSGEKNLSRSLTVNNQVLFTTYAPIAPTDACSPGSGQGFIYALDVVTGDPVLPLNGGSGSGDLEKEDRKRVLSNQSIPPSPTAAIADIGGAIRTSVIVGTETPLNDLPFSDLTKRTYWQDLRRGETTPATCRSAAGRLGVCR